VACTRQTKCGYDEAVPVVDCYCGSNSTDECMADGPASDAPCKDEWQAAAGGATFMETLNNIADLTHASGWAFYLLECDRKECADVCVPKK
jgi:hypothetical protein